MPAPEGNKFAEGNPGGGRDSSYKPEYAKAAEKLCELGATDAEIADAFGVSTRTIYSWKHKFEEFSSALKAGKEVADERVERSLYQKATGYDITEEQAIKVKVEQHVEKVEVVAVQKHVPSDTTAAIFWLKNRRSGSWRDKTEQQTTLSADESVIGLLERIAANGTKLHGKG